MSKESERTKRQNIDLEQLKWDPRSFLTLNPDDVVLHQLEMLRLHRLGHTAKEIADAFGCSAAEFVELRARFERGGVQALIERRSEVTSGTGTLETDHEETADQGTLKHAVLRPTVFRDAEWQAYAKTGGAWFGLIFALGFCTMVWGFHAYQLWRHSMIVPWCEVIAGLILCGGCWAVAGRLAGAARLAGWAALTGAIAGLATPWVIWLAKMLGGNLMLYADRRFWGPAVVQYGDALRVRLFFIGFWGVGLGAFAGLLERVLLPRAWDVASPGGWDKVRSVGVFLLCMPVALLFGVLADDLLQRDLRDELEGTYRALSAVQLGQPERPFLTWNYGGKQVEVRSSWEWPLGDFSIHLVDYDADSMDAFFFDAVYEDGTTVRCRGGAGSVQWCGNVSDALQQQMENLVQRGLAGDLEALQCDTCDPYIEPRVISSLDDVRSKFTAKYDIIKDAQRGGVVLMTARFDTGYELKCRFYGEAPIVLDSCRGKRPAL